MAHGRHATSILCYTCAMWRWSLTWGSVTPSLLVGSCPRSPEDIYRIQAETGSTTLLSLQHDDCLSYWGIDERQLHEAGQDIGLHLVRCPIQDFNPMDARRVLPVALRLLGELQLFGGPTYVHCTAGLGRAPVTVWSYLVFALGYDPDHAHELIMAARPGAMPAWEALEGCRHDLVALYRSVIEKRAYDLYEQGVQGGREAHWYQAVTEVIQSVLTS